LWNKTPPQPALGEGRMFMLHYLYIQWAYVLTVHTVGIHTVGILTYSGHTYSAVMIKVLCEHEVHSAIIYSS